MRDSVRSNHPKQKSLEHITNSHCRGRVVDQCERGEQARGQRATLRQNPGRGGGHSARRETLQTAKATGSLRLPGIWL